VNLRKHKVVDKDKMNYKNLLKLLHRSMKLQYMKKKNLRNNNRSMSSIKFNKIPSTEQTKISVKY
jgi:hypothetical protein